MLCFQTATIFPLNLFFNTSLLFLFYLFLTIILGDFLKTLEDPDLNVRRVALVTFNSAAHNKPSLIRDLLDTVLPHLYNETKVRKELIREVGVTYFLLVCYNCQCFNPFSTHPCCVSG